MFIIRIALNSSGNAAIAAVTVPEGIWALYVEEK